VQGFVGFDVEKRIRRNAPRCADAAEIVAQQIDDHHIFTTVFAVILQEQGEFFVFLSEAAPPDGPFHGPDRATAGGVLSEEKLR